MSGFAPYFKDVIISEVAGYQKPDKRYFDYLFAKHPEFSKDLSLIIGDSLSSDIRGGNNAGIDTCWYNPRRMENKTDCICTYEIAALEELYTILL